MCDYVLHNRSDVKLIYSSIRWLYHCSCDSVACDSVAARYMLPVLLMTSCFT